MERPWDMEPHEDGCRGREGEGRRARGSAREKNEDITMLHVIATLSLSVVVGRARPSSHHCIAADFRSAINFNEMPRRTEIDTSTDHDRRRFC